MRFTFASLALSLGIALPAIASERTMFVSGDGLNVRYCPGTSCCIASRLDRNDAVSVLEQADGWARISAFHDFKLSARSCEAPEDGLAAHWVAMDYLTDEVPAGTDPDAWFGTLSDRRIRGIPKVGDYGLTRTDLELIRRYASRLLREGVCEAIDTGNKSVSRADTYYVACAGESEQRYFTASDLDS